MFYYCTVGQPTKKMLRLLILTVLMFLCTTMHVGIMADSLSDRDFIHDVFKRLADLERGDMEQQAELEILRETNLQLVQEIDRLHERDVQLTDRIRLLEHREVISSQTWKQMGDYVKKENVLSDDFRGNISDHLQPKHDPSEKTRIVTTSKQELFHKDGLRRTRQVGKYKTIAFSAKRGNTHAEHLGQHQPLVFDLTITNIGQGYHNSAGIFTAPKSGVYVFSTTILCTNESASFDFVKNGHAYTSMYAYSTEAFETLSQTIVLALNKGDDVAIQSWDSDKFVHGFGYSTFSGFLLAADDNDAIIG